MGGGFNCAEDCFEGVNVLAAAGDFGKGPVKAWEHG